MLHQSAISSIDSILSQSNLTSQEITTISKTKAEFESCVEVYKRLLEKKNVVSRHDHTQSPEY